MSESTAAHTGYVVQTQCIHEQEPIRFWIAAADGGEVSFSVLIGAEITLNSTATTDFKGADSGLTPPAAAVVAATQKIKGGRLMVAEFQVKQVMKLCA